MATTKSILPEGSSLQYYDDGSFSLIEVYHVSGLTSTDEDLARPEAMTAVGVTLASTKAVTFAGVRTELRMMTTTVKLLSKTQAAVTIQWGINDSPILDGTVNGGWVFETYSDSSREPRGLDAGNVPITVKYQPADMGDTQWGEDWNQRRYNRGMTVPGFTNRPRIIGRRQISYVEAGKMTPHPLSWPTAYVDYVNDVVDAGKATEILKGVFRCSSIRVYTRNRALSYFVEAEFIRDPLGHDPMILFMDSQTGLVPADVSIDEGMKAPFATVRSSSTKPYGASRPIMVKGAGDFGAWPLNIDLRPFNRTKFT